MAVYTTINKSNDYFKTVLYTGTHSSVPTVTVGFKSDFLWLKSRTQTYDHNLLDTTRGGNSKLASNNSNAQSTTGDSVTFNATSFEPSGQAINEAGQGTNNMVSWSWKANGGTTSSNTDGSITSTVQANTTVGFSIITYSGNGSNNATVGHGLGTTPQMIITKNRSAAYNWIVYHPTLAATKILVLDMTLAEFTPSGGYYSNVGSSTYQLVQGSSNLTNVNANGNDYVAYCFAEKQGYSKFGSYTGNGNANGPFIYTGFQPAWLMIKRTDSTGEWIMMDNQRTDYPNANPVDQVLYADASTAEYSETQGVDFVSNGFKQREGGAGWGNASGGTYVYMAFAEHPFVTSDGVPTTAR